MNCKNCRTTLIQQADYCHNCGALSVTDRITFKKIVSQGFSDLFGWDSSYWQTLKTMALKPEKVIHSFLSGVRKQYLNPFRFLLIALTISVVVFNLFADEFLLLMEQSSTSVNEFLYGKDGLSEEQIAIQEQWGDAYSSFLLKNYTIIMTLFLPVYALMSKFSFRRQHNFGEHVVMNAYLQGFIYIFSSLFFLLSFLINPLIYNLSLLITIIIYMYVFIRIYQLNFIQSIVALLRFILVNIILLVALIVVAVLVGFLYAKLFL